MRQLSPVFILVAACSSDPAANNVVDTGTPASDMSAASDASSANNGMPDGGTPDQSSAVDMAVGEDAAVSDLGGDMPAADLGGDVAIPDMVDMGADPYAGRPIGQCTENADCPDGPQGRLCNRPLPGGSCQGCGNDGDCPAGTSCSMFGACIADCNVDDDCAPGLRCLGSRRCAAQSCVAGVCPVPLFGCTDNGLCQRIDCSQDPALCPDGTTCIDDLCIEDRANP